METLKPNEKEEVLTDIIGFYPKRVWHTFFDLLTKPGKVIDDYCNGIRSKYLSPITYFILAYGVSYFVLELSGFISNEDGTGEIDKLANLFNDFFISHPRLHDAFINAFFVVFSKNVLLLVYGPSIVITWWILFLKSGKPFLHHLYFILFSAAQLNLILIPFEMKAGIEGPLLSIIEWLNRIVSAAYFIYAAKTFYSISYLNSSIRYLLGKYVLMYLPTLIFLALVHSIVTFYLYYFN